MTESTAGTGSTGSYTVPDEGKGRITAIGPNHSYLLVGARKLIWGPSTAITVNTEDGERHVIDEFVQVGMKAQWKGLRDRATNTVTVTSPEAGTITVSGARTADATSYGSEVSAPVALSVQNR